MVSQNDQVPPQRSATAPADVALGPDLSLL